MIDDVRRNPMMNHLSEALDRGEDIGHYGRLVYVMVARHFASDDELTEMLAKDRDFSAEQAQSLIAQVREADYSPPKRQKILDYQGRQTFPILPDSGDPDDGNVYRDLEFPEHVYQHISEYREAKAHAAAD